MSESEKSPVSGGFEPGVLYSGGDTVEHRGEVDTVSDPVGPTNSLAAMFAPADPNLRMNAYYFSFEPTGIGVIDEILSAVARAGKAFHHTDMWATADEYVPVSFEEQIQAAAQRAAETLRGAARTHLAAAERDFTALRALAETLSYGSSVDGGGLYVNGWNAATGYAADEIRSIVGDEESGVGHDAAYLVNLAPEKIERLRASLRRSDRDFLSPSAVIEAAAVALDESPRRPLNPHEWPDGVPPNPDEKVGPVKLYVDDRRDVPEGWLVARTSAAAIEALSRFDVVEISFDHDLGGEDTSRPVVQWLIDSGRSWPAVVRVHTSNVNGRDWLEAAANKDGPGVTR